MAFMQRIAMGRKKFPVQTLLKCLTYIAIQLHNFQIIDNEKIFELWETFFVLSMKTEWM